MNLQRYLPPSSCQPCVHLRRTGRASLRKGQAALQTKFHSWANCAASRIAIKRHAARLPLLGRGAARKPAAQTRHATLQSRGSMEQPMLPNTPLPQERVRHGDHDVRRVRAKHHVRTWCWAREARPSKKSPDLRIPAKGWNARRQGTRSTASTAKDLKPRTPGGQANRQAQRTQTPQLG